jgi:hypothetical protein
VACCPVYRPACVHAISFPYQQIPSRSLDNQTSGKTRPAYLRSENLNGVTGYVPGDGTDHQFPGDFFLPDEEDSCFGVAGPEIAEYPIDRLDQGDRYPAKRARAPFLPDTHHNIPITRPDASDNPGNPAGNCDEPDAILMLPEPGPMRDTGDILLAVPVRR